MKKVEEAQPSEQGACIISCINVLYNFKIKMHNHNNWIIFVSC